MPGIYSHWDILLPPIYLILIFFFAMKKMRRRIGKEPHYKYYIPGLMVKLFGAISVCIVYTFYYRGGDTTIYFESANSLLALAGKNFGNFLETYFGERNSVTYSMFDNSTGWPAYWKDGHSFWVVRIVTVFSLLGCKSFITTAIVMAWAAFSGIWRLYMLFIEKFPRYSKELAIAILFIPSVFFWGSGILKDTITLSAAGWYTYSFYHVFIKRNISPFHITGIIISSFLMLAIKPYILFALLPGSTIWFAGTFSARIQNQTLKTLFAPFLVVIGLGLGFLVLSYMQDSLGQYSFENILEKAVVSQRDQKQAYYEGNSFDIGDFDATIPSMLSVSHKAIFAALFRPGLWEVKNIVMLLSALENAYILLLTITLLVRLKIWGFFSLIAGDALLLFSLTFAVFFAFSVGISISNFGTLVRLKIPCIPFFVASLFILRGMYQDKFKRRLGI